MRTLLRSLAPTLLVALVAPFAAGQEPGPLTPDRKAALDAVRAESIQGHLAFLASDLLEGRDTPSRGLDLAALYIAAQFRRAGLEPAGDDGYFQTARWKVVGPDPASFRLTIRVGEAAHEVPVDRVSFPGARGLDLDGAGLLRVDAADFAAVDALPAEQVEGKAVVLELAKAGEDRGAAARLLGRLTRHRPAVVIDLDRSSTEGLGLGNGRLVDPEAPDAPRRPAQAGIPIVSLHDPAAIAALSALAAGPAEGSVTLRVGEPVERPAAVRNVAGILRGSDPALKDEYVIVSAHYDHIGVGRADGRGDRINNGANDDASGTVGVIEMAAALDRLESRPKRSILFLTFFGEEKGLLGSRYYGRHPLVPLVRTVAHVNLEQIGRTDDSEGPSLGRAMMTGFDFSDVGPILARAGEAVGVEVAKHPRNSDAFFGRSDNQALADLGIPAHTLCTAFLFPDYHRPGDEWEKVDAANMAKVTRAIALGLLLIADADQPPRWNADNPKAARYLKAGEALHAAPGR